MAIQSKAGTTMSTLTSGRPKETYRAPTREPSAWAPNSSIADTGEFVGPPTRDQYEQMYGYPIAPGATTNESYPLTPEASDSSGGIGKAFGYAGSMITQDAANRKAVSRLSYNDQLAAWRDEGKWWMDPNSNVQPNLTAYMDQMPSSRESLLQGTLTQGSLSNEDGSANTLGLVINPAGYIENFMGDDWKGAGEYVWNNAVNRAITGTSIGGGWGAVAGAAVGIVEGIFNWNGAIEEDKEKKAAALAKYTEALKRWQESQRRRMVENNVQLAVNNYNLNKTIKSNKAKAQWNKRNLFLQTVSDAIGRGNLGSKPATSPYKAPTIRG